MFTRRSRYYRLPEMVAVDRNTRRFASKSLRPNANVHAKFYHTLDANDRLDHLAYKYYKQSLHWWRICDANKIQSPLALVDNTPFKTIQISVASIAASPSWSELFLMLNNLNGIEKIIKGNSAMPVPEKEMFLDSALFSIGDVFLGALQQSLLSQELNASLNAEFMLNGLVISGEVKLYELGVSLWRLHEMNTGNVYFIRLSDEVAPVANTLDVFEGIVQSDWVIEVCYNDTVVSYEEISNQIQSLDFKVQGIEKISRAGKSILIPPRFIG